MSCQQFHTKKYLSLRSITIYVKHNESNMEIFLRRNTGSKLHIKTAFPNDVALKPTFEFRLKKHNPFSTKTYLFKVNNMNTRKSCETLFKVNKKNTRTTSVSIIDFEQANASWVETFCNSK